MSRKLMLKLSIFSLLSFYSTIVWKFYSLILGLIKLVSKHRAQVIYTRNTKGGDAPAAGEDAWTGELVKIREHGAPIQSTHPFHKGI